MPSLPNVTRLPRGFALAALATMAVLAIGPPAVAAAQRSVDVSDVRAGTAALVEARASWAASPATTDRTAAAKHMLAVAAMRLQAMTRVVDERPDLAQSIALPAAEIERFPAFVRPYLEDRRTVAGTLEVRWADYGDHARRMDVLRSEDRQWQVRYTSDPSGARLRTGTSIRAAGIAVGELLALDPDATGAPALADASTSTSLPLPYVLGEQRVLVVPVNFTASAGTPYSQDEVRSQFFGSVDAYYRDVSAGRTWLSGDVTPWLTLDLDPNVCDVESVAALADQAARARGFDPAGYGRIAYVMPAMTCGWAGLAVTGPTLPTRTWLTTVQTRVISHELGHNLGLHHSRGRTCGDLDPWSSACQSYEYGDLFDIMGNASGSPFNALQMRRLGYLDADAGAKTALVTATGDYTIGTYAALTSLPRALRIPAGTDPVTGVQRTLYVTLRQPVGRDAGLAFTSIDSERLNRGIVVNAGWEAEGDGFVVDSTPLSQGGISDLNDSPILVGESLTDPESGVTIAPRYVGDGSAVIAIALNGANSPPSPLNQAPVATDDRASVTAGSSVSIAVLSNDFDPDGDPMTVQSVVQAAHGQVSIGSNGTVTYRPAKRFTGTDTFSYVLSDGSATDTGAVTVTVSAATKSGRSR